ncbi:MAG: DUF445 family protein [Chitinispirillaceae bacterium]|nr:DUF445 family protein [Chitinispirillaceae bacterium]
MRILLYCSLPFITALIGWFTNFLAVKMIFRPRREVRIAGFKIIGLIPKRKHDLAVKIAETIEKELISHRDIREILQTEDFHLHTGNVIKKRIDRFIDEKLAANPLLSMFVTPEVAGKLTETLMEELQKEIPGLIDSLFESVEKKIDFRKIIQEKIDGFDLSRLESIIYAIAAKELKAIEIFGGVLGFVVGLLQLLILFAGGGVHV